MSKTKGIKAKIVKHEHRRRFQEYIRTKNRDKSTLAYVYWSMYLRSGKGNMFKLIEELFLADLGLSENTLRLARKTLVQDGWLSKEKQTFDSETGKWFPVRWCVHEQPIDKTAPQLMQDGTDTQLTEIGSTEDGSTEDGSLRDTVVLHLLYADASTSTVTPSSLRSSAYTSSEEKEEEEKRSASESDSVFSFSPEELQTLDELQAIWFKHTAHKFNAEDREAALRLVKDVGLASVRSYLSDTFLCPKTSAVPWRDFSYWSEQLDLTKSNLDAWRRTKRLASKSNNADKPAYRQVPGSEIVKPGDVTKLW